MTTLRRLLLVLLALAVLPGAQAYATIPVQAGATAAPVVATAQPDGCHDARNGVRAAHPAAHLPGTAAATREAGPVMPPAACCPGHDDAPACGGACTCSLQAPGALAHAEMDGPAAHGAEHWQRRPQASRTSPAQEPPKRPPIA